MAIPKRALEVHPRRSLRRTTLAIALALSGGVLGACGGGEEEAASTDAEQAKPAPAETNSPPVISGKPDSEVIAGNQYVFEPKASDSNGDILTFSIRNLPRWATFDAATGRLQGTPDASHVGLYAGIEIAVTDGSSSRTLPAFTVEVLAQGAGNGTATLSWVAPTQKMDGTPLGGLAGYKVYYGKEPRRYTNTIVVNNPGVTTYVVDSLSSGTWYFAATAFDTSGLESTFSNEVSKLVQ